MRASEVVFVNFLSRVDEIRHIVVLPEEKNLEVPVLLDT
jgi:hypothetical protein